MEKVKYMVSEDTFNECEEMMFEGVSVSFLVSLNSEQMEQFAREYVQMVCAIDDVSEIAYIGYDRENAFKYLVIKYFSNIDVSGLTENDAADIYNVHYWKINENTTRRECIEEARCLSDIYLNTTIKVYESMHSFEHKISMLVGQIGDGNIIEKLAQSKMVNDEMIDLIHDAEKYRETNANQNVVLFQNFKKKGK